MKRVRMMGPMEVVAMFQGANKPSFIARVESSITRKVSSLPIDLPPQLAGLIW